jgi:hypothetical protein
MQELQDRFFAIPIGHAPLEFGPGGHGSREGSRTSRSTIFQRSVTGWPARADDELVVKATRSLTDNSTTLIKLTGKEEQSWASICGWWHKDGRS